MDLHIARISPMLMTCLFAFSNIVGTCQAELIYTFSGQVPSDLPPSAYTHPKIGPGETWVATLVVDETTPGSYWGLYYTYAAAVKSGSLVFSGGYVSPLNFEKFQFLVDDRDPNDYINVHGGNSNDEIVTISAWSDRNPLSSSGMPVAGSKFIPGPSDNPNTFWCLIYQDRLGVFNYSAQIGSNVAFSASVPEPASLVVASLLGGALVLARRRR